MASVMLAPGVRGPQRRFRPSGSWPDRVDDRVGECCAGARVARSSFLGGAGIIDWAECDRTARDALSRIGCDIEPDTRVQSLSRTEKSLVAIARALVVECDFLVLDEPTASLPADEVARLFAAMGALKAAASG